MKQQGQDATSEQHAHASFVENVIPQLMAWRRAGLRSVLLTLVGIDGSSPRPLGSQMAVNELGQWVGNITSGCAEAALATEAVIALQATEGRLQRYGKGSRYMDAQLPCGSGIDVYFDPNISDDMLEEIERAQTERRATALHITIDQDAQAHNYTVTPIDAWHSQCTVAPQGSGTTVVRPYPPQTRVCIAGKGPAVTALARIAEALDWQVVIITPANAIDAVAELSAPHRVVPLDLPIAFDPSIVDPWTAMVLLFHDHDWEPPILAKVLKRDAFYVGAMGSRRTHQQRCEVLQQLGIAQKDISRINAPIGLDIGALSPPEIALAVAAQIQQARYARQTR